MDVRAKVPILVLNWHIGTLGPPDTGRNSVVLEHLGHQPPGETSATYLYRPGGLIPRKSKSQVIEVSDRPF